MDAVGTPESVLLLGGTSEIGLAIVERLAGAGSLRAVLAARPSPRRDAAAARLRALGHEVQVVDFDGEDVPSHASVVDQAFGSGDVDVVVVALGVLGDQEQAWQDHAAALRTVSVNYTAAVSTGVLLAARLRGRARGGRRAVVRGGGAAAPVELRLRVQQGRAGRVLHRPAGGAAPGRRARAGRPPGFVRSRMTEGLEAAPLSTTPEAVAEAVRRALVERRDVVWVPSALRWVMSGLRHVPAPLFRRLPI
jgi:decaprenylphospho-beta-D-erythro-pentofuranosid-2-ulose 2-reductase